MVVSPQLAALAAAAYRAVAPYLRGHALSDPAPDGGYDLDVLGQDPTSLIGR